MLKHHFLVAGLLLINSCGIIPKKKERAKPTETIVHTTPTAPADEPSEEPEEVEPSSGPEPIAEPIAGEKGDQGPAGSDGADGQNGASCHLEYREPHNRNCGIEYKVFLVCDEGGEIYLKKQCI